MLTVLKYIALVGTFFIYTTSGVFSKLASQREFLSLGYMHGGRAGDLRGAVAADHQADGREPSLHSRLNGNCFLGFATYNLYYP